MCQVKVDYLPVNIDGSSPNECLGAFSDSIYLVRLKTAASGQYLSYVGYFAITGDINAATFFTGGFAGVDTLLYFKDGGSWYAATFNSMTFLMEKGGEIPVYYDGVHLKATYNATTYYLNFGGGIPFFSTMASNAAVAAETGNTFLVYNPAAETPDCQFILTNSGAGAAGGITNQNTIVNSPGNFSPYISKLCGMETVSVDLFDSTLYPESCYQKLKNNSGVNQYSASITAACSGAGACDANGVICKNYRDKQNTVATALPAAQISSGGGGGSSFAGWKVGLIVGAVVVFALGVILYFVNKKHRIFWKQGYREPEGLFYTLDPEAQRFYDVMIKNYLAGKEVNQYILYKAPEKFVCGTIPKVETEAKRQIEKWIVAEFKDNDKVVGPYIYDYQKWYPYDIIIKLPEVPSKKQLVTMIKKDGMNYLELETLNNFVNALKQGLLWYILGGKVPTKEQMGTIETLPYKISLLKALAGLYLYGEKLGANEKKIIDDFKQGIFKPIEI